MSNKQIALIIALMIAPIAFLYGWYTTQATQYLYLIGLLEVIGILLNIMAVVMLIWVIPKMEDSKFVETVAEMKEGLDHWLKYPVYVTMIGMMAALLYFNHTGLFTLYFIGLLSSIAIRVMTGWAVEAALKGAQE